MAKRKPGMTDSEFAAYKARIARRAIAACAEPRPVTDNEKKKEIIKKLLATPEGRAKLAASMGPPLKKADFPVFDAKMTKARLLDVAAKAGVTGVSMKNTKNDILSALHEAEAAK